MKKNLILVCAALTVFFAAYSALFVYDRYFRPGRMWETPAVKPYEKPMLVMEKGVVPVSSGSENPSVVLMKAPRADIRDAEAIYLAAVPESLVSPYSGADPQVLEQGKTGYFLYCYMCHGPDYDGQGTVGQSFAPLPGDLRSARVQSLADGTIFHEISYGIPGGRQPALATTILPEDRWKIVHYVKSLGVRP
ncbi:MAG: c-type cytochrome [Desulfobacterales bacterium]